MSRSRNWKWSHDKRELLEVQSDGSEIQIIVAIGFEHVAPKMDCSKADRDLISAAPNLLEALDEAKEMLRKIRASTETTWGITPIIEQSEKAIAKAKGLKL